MASVVVGVDTSGLDADTVSDWQTSPEKREALLAWSPALVQAVAEARLRGCALEVLSVWTYPPASFVDLMSVAAGDLETEANEAVGALVDATTGDEAAPEFSVNVLQGAPAHLLVEAARTAELLVVGRHDKQRLKHLMLGSVASHSVRHSSCPTMVVPSTSKVPGENGQRGQIVVGVDGSENSSLALRWALEQAARADKDVHMINAWLEPIAAGELLDPVPLMAMLEESAETQVADLLANTTVPDGVTLTGEAVRSDPTSSLVECSKTADLVVVGSRGRGGFAGLLLGSVSRNVAHRAECPAVVVPLSSY